MALFQRSGTRGCSPSCAAGAYRPQVRLTSRRVAGLRGAARLAERADRVVVGRHAGEDETQSEERFVRGGRPEALEGTVERLRPRIGGAVAERGRDRLGLRRDAVEEVAVEGVEFHAMRFATRPLALCVVALLAAAAPAHVRGTVERTVEGRRVVVTVDRAGGAELVRRCVAGVCAGTWFDGLRRWSFGVNEVLVPDDEAPAPDPLAPAALAAAAPVDQPLAPPAGPALTFAGDPGVALGDAPIPIVPCRVGRRPARCALDSGSTPSAIALRFAEDLGLEPRGELLVRAFGAYATGLVDAGPLELGAARFGTVRLAIAPATASSPFDVLVGADLLARLRIVLDRRARRASIGPTAPLPRGIALRFHQGVPTVDLTLDGTPARALVDTGDAAVVSLGYAAYRGGPQWTVLGRSAASGIAGADDAFEVALPSARAGALELGAVRALVRRTQRQAHLGIGLWSRCVVTLDLGAQRLACDV